MSVKKLKSSPVKAKKSSILGKIMPVDQIPDYSSILLYGESGTGKTALSGTFPKKMLILDIAEKGTKTLRKTPGIDVIQITEWDEIEEVYWYLHDNPTKYKTVSLDQVSQMQDLSITQVRNEKGMKEKDPMSQRLWGQASGLMKTWLYNYRELQNLNMHVVFIAHARTSGGGDEGDDNQIDPSVGARLMPSVASFLNGAVSYIGNTYIRERYIKEGKEKIRKVEYCLRVGPHAYYRTKIRKPPDMENMPDTIVNPTFEKLEKLSRGESLKVSSSKTVKRK